MSEVVQRLEAVHSKVADLLAVRAELHERLARQEAEARDHQRTLDVLQARVAELERENEVLRATRNLQAGEGSPEAKERIDALVNEIDRCLALLNT